MPSELHRKPFPWFLPPSCRRPRKQKRPHRESTDPLKRTKTSFRAMWERCTSPRASSWKYYGGRGICVCERWRSFENFVADLGLRPAGTTIDRFPNNDGNYEPGNVRWATAKQQGHSALGRVPSEAHRAAQRASYARAHQADVHAWHLDKWKRLGTLYTHGEDRILANAVRAALEEEFGVPPPDAQDYEGLAVFAEPQPILFYPPGDEATLEDIGQALGVTRERARQLEEAALGKLRIALLAAAEGRTVRHRNNTRARNLRRQMLGKGPLAVKPRKAA